MAEVLAPEELVDADAVQTTDTLTRGTRLGRYELLVPIAMGGMARVWAARQHGHRGFTKLVVIKTILPHLSQDAAFERMFLDEARIAAGVHHPNVCDIYELGEEGRVLYLAMEFVNGDSMVHLLRATGQTQPLDVRVAARIVADACAGLHAAHNLTDDEGRPLGVVHRDVSPHNILLSADGNVKVTDFGVAKAMGQLHEATVAGQLKGKINYMAPEQITSTHIDRRTDVFAMGCVLYEATTGKLPFKGQGHGDHQVMHNLVKGEYLAPTKVVRGYPAELEGIIARALANQPIQRFATAERLRLALEEWLAKSGSIVTQSHVAAVVKERLGPVIDKRKERIRAATQTTGVSSDDSSAGGRRGQTPSAPLVSNQSASGVIPAGAAVLATHPPRIPAGSWGMGAGPSAGHSASAPPVSVGSRATLPGDPPQYPMMPPPPGVATQPPALGGNFATAAVGGGHEGSTRQYALAAGIGIAVALIIVVGGFVAWRASRPSPPADSFSQSTTGTGVAPVSPPRATSAKDPAPPSTGLVVSSDPIVFRVVPPSAVIVVNGAPLPAGARSIPHPKPGETLMVVVRAAGYQDETLTVDATVSAPVDVVLTAVEVAAPPEPPPIAPLAPDRPADTPHPTEEHHHKKPPVALPASPY